jgi:hypothetical protein
MNKMKNKKYNTVKTVPKSRKTNKYNTVGTVPKSNRKTNKIQHCQNSSKI